LANAQLQTLENRDDSLENDREWQARETAATALGQMYRDYTPQIGRRPIGERLEQLADDINWRVRRQVGNTLDELCRLAPQPSFALLRDWASRPDSLWRLRRAVVQARIGLLRNRELALELLPALIEDQVEEIRWRAVSDLANLVKTSPAPFRQQALPLLRKLSHDSESIWVRRHVAFWLPDLYQIVGPASADIATALIHDSKADVRWETARALGSFIQKDRQQALQWLRDLLTDQDVSTQFAARYSVAQLNPDPTVLAALLEPSASDDYLRARVEWLARSSRVPEKPSGLDLLDNAKPDRFDNIQEVLKQGAREFSADQLKRFFKLLCDDEDEGIRWASAGLLATFGAFNSSEKDAILIGYANDPHYWTRREGLGALSRMMRRDGFMPSAALASQLVTSGGDKEPEVRREAFVCLRWLLDRRQSLESSYPYQWDAMDLAWRRISSDPDRQIRALAA
jgi:HEAT repeat protein